MAEERMDEATLLALVRSVRPSFTRDMLAHPVAETTLDSFDLLALRSLLETHLARPIEDRTWLGARSLRVLLDALT